MTADILDDPDISLVRRIRPMGEGGGSLYVIEIGPDRIKVGWSRRPASRLRSHRSAAEAHGLEPGREWITPPVANNDDERALIDFCARRATKQVSREYFVGVDFDAAVLRAADVTGYSAEQRRDRVQDRSPNTKYWVSSIARLLWTAGAAIDELIARGDIEPRDPDEVPLTITRRALLDWLDTNPDLLALPRASA